MNKSYQFYGGVHPAQQKLARKSAIAVAPLFPFYTVPLSMHIGAPAKPIVKIGDKVLRGQMIAEAGGFVSAPVHSPTSGTIKDIKPCLGVTGVKTPCFIIESDGEDKEYERMKPFSDWQEADPKKMLSRIAEAGVVGMGGAAFPTAVKLSPPPGKKIDTLILNGIECEPCLTDDHRLMLEKAKEILIGIQISARILDVKTIILGIEKNKPDAVEVMTEQAKDLPITVFPLNVRYPQGAEKQLIFALTKRKVPTGGLPMDVGCVVQNVASAFAVYNAVYKGIPLYERVTTITGTPLVSPGNWHLRIGTSFADAIRLAGGVKEDPAKIISGGPMMGFSVYSLEIPITKNSSGILLMSPSEITQFQSKSCIHCGRCNDVCPMQLMPGILSTQIENECFDLSENWNVLNCLDCGCCSYICPAGRPLVQHMRRAKAEIMAKRKEAKKDTPKGKASK